MSYKFKVGDTGLCRSKEHKFTVLAIDTKVVEDQRVVARIERIDGACNPYIGTRHEDGRFNAPSKSDSQYDFMVPTVKHYEFTVTRNGLCRNGEWSSVTLHFPARESAEASRRHYTGYGHYSLSEIVEVEVPAT